MNYFRITLAFIIFLSIHGKAQVMYPSADKNQRVQPGPDVTNKQAEKELKGENKKEKEEIKEENKKTKKSEKMDTKAKHKGIFKRRKKKDEKQLSFVIHPSSQKQTLSNPYPSNSKQDNC